MPAKLTTQEFIDRARAVHGRKYGYAFSVYSGSKSKLTIHCPDHGLFEQRSDLHLSGHGCPDCAGVNKNTSTIIDEFKKVHGNNYDYSNVNYINSRIKINIICKIHGVFYQNSNKHLSGQGCSKCYGNKKHSRLSFIKKAKEVHGDKYDYSRVNYISIQKKVTIVCSKHGSFSQTPLIHFNGSGCPGCAKSGFDRTKKGFLYILRSDCGQYMKIGITNNPKQRHNKLKRDTPFSFKRIELIEGPGGKIAEIEKVLLAEYQPVQFDSQFDGSTEWRLFDESISHRLSLHH